MKMRSHAVLNMTTRDDDISIDSNNSDEYIDSSGTRSEMCTVERDEVKEVQKSSSGDTRSVNLSRLAATFALLVTALIVTVATYSILKAEEKNNFETAVSV